ncbi:hypothetical protein [Methanogenium cariaci]|nr:hypothetical protein [Methanogenium cariaci]
MAAEVMGGNDPPHRWRGTMCAPLQHMYNVCAAPAATMKPGHSTRITLI